jgi:hypothetical protein
MFWRQSLWLEADLFAFQVSDCFDTGISKHHEHHIFGEESGSDIADVLADGLIDLCGVVGEAYAQLAGSLCKVVCVFKASARGGRDNPDLLGYGMIYSAMGEQET